jgi:hypothetical protein
MVYIVINRRKVNNVCAGRLRKITQTIYIRTKRHKVKPLHPHTD